MSLRYRTVLPAMVVCLALGVAPVHATGKSAPTIATLGNAPAPTATHSSHECQFGQFGAPAFSAQFVFPPNDEYLTRLDFTSCCEAGLPITLDTAHALLNWPSNCAIPVSVSILASTGTGSCLVPDPDRVLCGPTLYVIDGGAGGFVQHDLPLPAGCCIQGPAFLKIEFVSLGSCPPNPSGLDAPRLLGDGDGQTCVSYNFYPGDPVYRDVVTAYGFPGNPLMWANGVFCTCITPTIPATWGRVKTIYR